MRVRTYNILQALSQGLTCQSSVVAGNPSEFEEYTIQAFLPSDQGTCSCQYFIDLAISQCIKAALNSINESEGAVVFCIPRKGKAKVNSWESILTNDRVSVSYTERFQARGGACEYAYDLPGGEVYTDNLPKEYHKAPGMLYYLYFYMREVE